MSARHLETLMIGSGAAGQFNNGYRQRCIARTLCSVLGILWIGGARR